MFQSEDRRTYFRVQLHQPISSLIKIISVNGRKINSRSSTVRVHDIGAGGLKFSSFLSFPITADALFLFSFNILGTDFSLKGNLVRKVETDKEGFEYGVAFSLEEQELNLIIRILNDFALRQHHKQSLKGTSVCRYDSRCIACSCSKLNQVS